MKKLVTLFLVITATFIVGCSGKKSGSNNSNTESNASGGKSSNVINYDDLDGFINAATFDKKGELKEFKDGYPGKDGVYETFYNDGILHQHFNFQNGKANGEFLYYLDTEGRIVAKEIYKDNLANGVWEEYDMKGGILHQQKFESGYQTGLETRYFSDDVNKSSGMGYMELDGVVSNGKLKESINWKNGFKHGLYKKWQKDGTLTEETHYYLNNPLKTIKYFFSGKNKGKPQDIIFYQLNDNNYSVLKESTSYYESTGKIKEKRSYDAKGNPDGDQLGYCDNGQLGYKEIYKNGTRNGMQQYWNCEGKLTYSCKYVDGLRDGEEIEFYEDGKTLKSKGVFEQGLKMGAWEYYNPNGTIKLKGEYKDGDRFGYWEKYTSNGKLSSRDNRSEYWKSLKNSSRTERLNFYNETY